MHEIQKAWMDRCGNISFEGPDDNNLLVYGSKQAEPVIVIEGHAEPVEVWGVFHVNGKLAHITIVESEAKQVADGLVGVVRKLLAFPVEG